MRRDVRGFSAAWLIITAFLQTGCVDINTLDPNAIVSGLSYLALRPDETCEELRERYRLDYLPVVEKPSDVGLTYEEHWLLVEGSAVRVWYFPTNLARGLVVFSNGNAGAMSCYMFGTRLLTRNGWSVVMYDYEGFGPSGGRPTLDALRRDLEAVMDWARAYIVRDQVTLMGLSLGSIPTVAVAVARPDAVNAVVLDSPVALAALIERFAYLVGGQTEPILSRLDADLLPDVLIAQLEQPLLVFLHELDSVATPATVELLFERAPGPKELVRFTELGHARGQFFSTDVYTYHLERFLTSVWAPPGQPESSRGRDEAP